MRKEKVARLQKALEELKDIDREVVVLRNFEGLTNTEVARILGLSKPGASLRYVRAMQRLGEVLLDLQNSPPTDDS